MQSKLINRLLLVLAAGTLLANAGFGACGGDSPGFGGDGGSGANDLGFAPADGAFASGDLGASARDTLQLLQPQPLASNVQVSANLELAAFLVHDTPQDLEPLITISPRGTSSPISGAFSWKQLGSGYKVTFIPNAPLADNTDYEVVATDPKQPATLLKTAFSTGSRPRVVSVDLHAENAAALVYFDIGFSEPMVTPSVTQVKVTAGAKVVTGSLSVVTGTNRIRFVFDNGRSLGSSLQLELGGGITAVAGGMLLPASWDSPTTVDGGAPGGNFELSFQGLSLDTASATAPFDDLFTPTIN